MCRILPIAEELVKHPPTHTHIHERIVIYITTLIIIWQALLCCDSRSETSIIQRESKSQEMVRYASFFLPSHVARNPSNPYICTYACMFLGRSILAPRSWTWIVELKSDQTWRQSFDSFQFIWENRIFLKIAG